MKGVNGKKGEPGWRPSNAAAGRQWGTLSLIHGDPRPMKEKKPKNGKKMSID